ncbi:MAG: histidine kinase, partial [Alphaproteobacteria bacterium]|nr:histidine kinase [Alphaproteobacteria bacterium]
MSGRILIIGLLLIAAVAGAGLWYAQVYAYYQPVEGLSSVTIDGAA